ncbi:uncharacterized protein [Rutidosis leptorrhynchoides]|uniref:uncharacterized protein n=1 Tax=Rutidosis leptorrhynchoides TaxID=125765 RepID=UPI003A98FA34
MSWVRWDKILGPFVRGLNIGGLKAFNLALIYKWRWRFLTNPNDMWVALIKSIHGPLFEKTNSHTSTWSSIVANCSNISIESLLPSDCFKMKIGYGRNISFWLDLWCGNSTLKSRFNRLYHLDLNKLDVLADKHVEGMWQWQWVRDITSGCNAQLFDDLLVEIGNCSFNDQPDSWSCSLSAEGVFSVKDARVTIDNILLPYSNTSTLWFKFIPRKVNIFLWRLRLDSLLVR